MLDIPTRPGATAPHRRQAVASLLSALLEDRGKGETPALAARLAPDFVYRAVGAWPAWPFHRGPIDRAEFVAAAGRLNDEFERVGSEIHELLIDGDRAAAHLSCTARSRGAGAPVNFDLWIFLRLRDALIVEMAVYVDAAKAAKLLPGGIVEVQPDARAAVRAKAATRRPADDPVGRHQAFLRHVALDFFALRAKGDLPAMLGRLAPDFIHNLRGDWTKAPFMPDRCDLATFAEALRMVNIEFEDLGGEVHDILVDGDRIAAHRTIKLRNRGSGAVAEVDEWVCFRIVAGLIVELASYVDAARVARVDWPAYATPR